MKDWCLTVMPRLPAKDGQTRKPARYHFHTEEEVDRVEVWSLLHDYGFCCLRKVNGQVGPLPGLIVYVTNGEL
jgi:hypothetical protein